MIWLLLTALAIASRAAYGITSKVLTRTLNVSSAAQAVLQFWVCVPMSALAAPFLGGVSLNGIGSEWIAIAVMVASVTLGGPLYFKGIQRVDAGVGQIAFSSIIVWGALLSVGILGSHFSMTQLAGSLALIGAIWLAQFERGTHVNQSVGYVLCAAACYACFQVASARASHSITAGTYLLLAYSGPALLMTMLYARSIRRQWKALKARRAASAAVAATIPSAALSVAFYTLSFWPSGSHPMPASSSFCSRRR